MNLQRLFLLLTTPAVIACAHGRAPINQGPSPLEKSAAQQKQKEAKAVRREVQMLLKSLGKNDQVVVSKSSKSEEELYAEVIGLYRLRDVTYMSAKVSELEQSYPDGVLTDNAIYLLGKLHYATGSYGESVKLFSKVIDSKGSSNKRPAALLAKGQAYHKLKLFDLAVDSFRTIESEFPGSPESYQVATELKLIDVEKMNP